MGLDGVITICVQKNQKTYFFLKASSQKILFSSWPFYWGVRGFDVLSLAAGIVSVS